MCGRRLILVTAMLLACNRSDMSTAAKLQEKGASASTTKDWPAAVAPDPTTPEPPKEVKVTDVVHDDDIGVRLKEILASTSWFRNAEVDVRNGVVFLSGTTKELKYKEWATALASKTEDAVAVVNHIKILTTRSQR